MLIHLEKSRLFTTDPAVRFANEYKVSKKLWNELWKRYLDGYDMDALCGYFMYKTDKKPSRTAMQRWITRTEIYCKATHVMRMGVRVVQSEYFGSFEDEVLAELTRHIKSGDTRDSRILL